MKKMILFLVLLLLSSCLNSTDSGYDNSDDIAYLEENAKKEGVIVTESGLQYRVIEEGDGEQPDLDSIVLIHYHGTLITEQVFDSSVDRNDPIEHPLAGFIPGFTEGLLLMNEGATYEFVIPANLAYGNNPPGHPLYPGATLIFEVELLEIVE